MGQSDLEGGAPEGAPAYPPEADPRAVRTAEMVRTVFDCSGTPWCERKSPSGTSCHQIPWPQGAPLIGDCTAYIEASLPMGGYKPVKPEEGARWSPFDVDDVTLYGLGGGRKYRVHLRHGGRSIPHSYLLFDLTGHGAPKPLPGEEPQTAAPARAPAAPVMATAEALALGAQPVEALLGHAVSKMNDPGMQLAFALVLGEARREREYRIESQTRDERLFQFMAGTIKEAARGGGGGGGALEAHLRAQADSASRLAEQASRDAREARDRLHEKELAEARAASSSTPSPVVPMAFNAMERVLTKGVEHLITTAGPEAARGVVSGVGAAAAAATTAAG